MHEETELPAGQTTVLVPLPLAPVAPAPVPAAGQPIEASTDQQALTLWLRTYLGGSKYTLIGYRGESRRFLAWLYSRRGVHPRLLPSVTQQDVADYVTWLSSEGGDLPNDTLAAVGLDRQPKRDRLAGPSLRRAVIVLHTMYRAFAEMRAETGPYAPFNPFHAAHKRIHGPRRANPRSRALSIEEWNLVQRALAEMPAETPRQRHKKARATWLCRLLYGLWLRRGEVWKLSMGDLRRVPSGWNIELTRKGGKEAVLPVPSALIDALREYRRFLGLPEIPLPGDPYPLFGRLFDPKKAATADTVYRTIQDVGERAAALTGDEHAAQRLRLMSPHWIRHTAISHFTDGGGDLRNAQYMASHSSIATTSLYDTQEIETVRAALERVSANRAWRQDNTPRSVVGDPVELTLNVSQVR